MLPETRCSEGLRGVAGEVCYGSVCVSIQARRRSRERARVNWSSGRRCRLLSCQWPLNVLLTDTDTDTAWIEAMDGPDANHTHTHLQACQDQGLRFRFFDDINSLRSHSLTLFFLLLLLLLLLLSLLDFFLLAAISFLEQLHTGRTQASSNPSGGRHCSETASAGVCYCSRADVTERASIED